MEIEERSGYNEERWMEGEGGLVFPHLNCLFHRPLLVANGNGPADGDPININREKINIDREKPSSLPLMFFRLQGQGQNNNQIIFLKADKQSYTTTNYIVK